MKLCDSVSLNSNFSPTLVKFKILCVFQVTLKVLMNFRTKLFLSEIHIRLILGVVVWVFDTYSEWKEESLS